MTDSDNLARARLRAQDFQREVERYVKPYHADALVVALNGALNSAFGKPELMRYWPPHYVIHAMEAACAFRRRHSTSKVTDDALRKLINVYHRYADPQSEYLLRELRRPDLFLILAARQQFYLQARVSKYDLSRAFYLFTDTSLPRTAARMRQELGFGFSDWIAFCLAVHDATRPGSRMLLHAEGLAEETGTISAATAARFLEAVSRSTDEVGRDYRALRENRGFLVYDPYLPSGFSERPLFRLSDGSYMSVHREFMLRRAAEGVYDLARSIWKNEFTEEFGGVFEEYVGRVLDQLSGARVFRERELQRYTADKVCDFAVVTDEFVLLVECKAVQYSATLTSEKALAGDQICTTWVIPHSLTRPRPSSKMASFMRTIPVAS